MKTKVTLVVGMLLCGVSFGLAQFKSQVQQEAKVSDALIRGSSPSLFFGWFNPDRFHMRHSFSFSYYSVAGQGLSLGTYTNTMTYQFADNLNARADVSMMFSPFSSFSTFNKNDLSSIYLSRAELNYKPWENVVMQLQYRQVPFGGYYYSPLSNPWYREDGF